MNYETERHHLEACANNVGLDFNPAWDNETLSLAVAFTISPALVPLFAHLHTKPKRNGGGFVLHIGPCNRPVAGKDYSFADKRSARKFAADQNATPWNF